MKTIKIKELGIEVEKELNPKVLKKDLIIPKGWRLLTLSEASYIIENNILDLGLKEVEWITFKGRVASLYSDGGRLSGGGYWVGSDGGFAFGVRFCRSLK